MNHTSHWHVPTALVLFGLALSSMTTSPAHAEGVYTTLVFMPLTPDAACTGSSGPSSGGSSSSGSSAPCSGWSSSGTVEGGVADITDLWTTGNIGLNDGGYLTADNYPNTVFNPGSVYLIDTDIIPDHGNDYGPSYGITRKYSIYAHWTAVRAWVQKAAETSDHLVIVGHSFSGPAVILAASTVLPAVAEKIHAVVTVTAPNAGLELANMCAFYSRAACDLQPDSSAMSLLRQLAENAVENNTRRLGEKHIAVAAELYNYLFYLKTYLKTDGFIPTESQLFLEPNWQDFRGHMGSTNNSDSYWAMFFETIDVGLNPLFNYHIDANTGDGMYAAATYIDNRLSWDLCRDYGPCGPGEGDCDPNQNQCEAGSACVNNVGGEFGLPSDIDMCVPDGHGSFCRDEACEAQEGDCDSHSDCSGSLRCLSDRGPDYGWRNWVDVCESRANGAADYCSSEFRCAVDEGHCDSTDECQSGLTCVPLTSYLAFCR